MISLEDLTTRMREFTEARDWGRFHDVKSLTLALAGEVSRPTGTDEENGVRQGRVLLSEIRPERTSFSHGQPLASRTGHGGGGGPPIRQGR